MFIGVDKIYSSDASKEAWEYYKFFYGNIIDWDFWEIFNYEKLKGKDDRLYAKCRKNFNSKYDSFKGCKLGGEMDFNFKSSKNWQSAKYEYYEGLLNSDEEAIKLLEDCKKGQYKCCNLSVMIKMGGLNNLKGKLSQGKRALDRFDVFIFTLNDYFEKRNKRNNEKEDFMHIIFSEAWHNAKDNRVCLYKYLSLFTDINDYFQKNYAIDNKDLIKDLIDSGSKPIDNRGRAIEYLRLAQRYWDEKRRKTLSKIPNIAGG